MWIIIYLIVDGVVVDDQSVVYVGGFGVVGMIVYDDFSVQWFDYVLQFVWVMVVVKVVCSVLDLQQVVLGIFWGVVIGEQFFYLGGQWQCGEVFVVSRGDLCGELCVYFLSQWGVVVIWLQFFFVVVLYFQGVEVSL